MNATPPQVPMVNNLTLVRLVLASAVIWSHSVWRITGADTNDPMVWLMGEPVSSFAVDGFFFLSGFLVYNSLLRRGSAWDFLLARLARLWPGLAVAVLVMVTAGFFIAGLPLPEYLRGDTAHFIASNLSLVKGHYALTGIGAEGAPTNVNGSLWTIPWEVRCYLVLFFAALLRLSSRDRVIALLLLPSLLFAIVIHLPAVQALAGGDPSRGALYNLMLFDRLWTMFALGIAALIFWPYLRLSWSVALLSLVALALSVHFFPIPHLAGLVTGYCVLCAGFRSGTTSARWSDYSYGMYIYAFPAMMVIAAIMPIHSAPLLALLTAAGTLPLAALSWHFVEHPVLRHVRERRRAGREARA
ncbi:MAG: acyltransferase [Candidatus Sphingomonas colombiensis]|nr:acyltransferase [Sphingomonas sp.]WEK44120.1 MAG: acyltransferase [Sphingomonas sp.]